MQNFQKSCKLIIVNIWCVLPDVFEMFILQGFLCSAGVSVEMLILQGCLCSAGVSVEMLILQGFLCSAGVSGPTPNYHNQQVYNSLPRIQVIFIRLVSIILNKNFIAKEYYFKVQDSRSLFTGFRASFSFFLFKGHAAF